MTPGQIRGYDLACDQLITEIGDVAGTISKTTPVGIEIGFGMGQALLHWAHQSPDWQLLGIELYQPGIGALADRLIGRELTNVRIIEAPAQQVLAQLPDDCLREARIFFPDPWPKKRHAKRRLVQPDFVGQLARVVAAPGRVCLATDWTAYAHWIRTCFAGVSQFQLEVDATRMPGAASTNEGLSDTRPTTKFEQRGEGLGHTIYDLVYTLGSDERGDD